MLLALSFCFKIALAIRGLHVFCVCVCVCVFVVPYELQDCLFYLCGECLWNFDR